MSATIDTTGSQPTTGTMGMRAARWAGQCRRDSATELPMRVRHAIRRQQDESERLVGWLQLGVGLVFGALYLVSPKAGAGIDLAPWAIALYLGLTIFRLAWCLVTRLPGWSLAISVVFDMALLMILIWSFHLKYGQPASFYLKAPTLLYVFIFIALRALRFEARYVILAGVVGALGWAGLLLFALVDPSGPGIVTRDYVSYMTSNAILIGGEVDKILTILVVTTIIAVALYRAQELLVRAVAEQAAVQDLSRFFAPEIAARIRSAESRVRAGTGELRDAAILNLDLRGFTRFASSVAPDDVMKLLSEYQALMVPVIRDHGGRVDKFLGDGILATFGAVERSPTYAADALRALDEIMVAAHRWDDTCRAAGRSCPKVNGALACGPVLFGAVGDDERLEYTVIGDAVNLSAKLEKTNKELGTAAICDLETYELACAQGYVPVTAPTILPFATVAGHPRLIRLVRVAS